MVAAITGVGPMRLKWARGRLFTQQQSDGDGGRCERERARDILWQIRGGRGGGSQQDLPAIG